MKAIALLLVCAIALTGCLQDFGNKVGIGDKPPAPYTKPELADATIRPGMSLGQPEFCTVNFLFLDKDGGTVYIGTAAHCVSTVADAETGALNSNGCDAANQPVPPGRAVTMGGAQHPVIIAYNSWHTMQELGEPSATVCNDNDFALLKLHPDDARRAHPSMLGFGGPTGIATDVAAGDVIYSFGSSDLLPRPEDADARQGLIVQAGTWSHDTYQATPGLPGDSGSPVIRQDGKAVGILVTLGITPLPGSNGVTDLQRAMEYAQEHTHLRFTLLTAPLAAASGLP